MYRFRVIVIYIIFLFLFYYIILNPMSLSILGTIHHKFYPSIIAQSIRTKLIYNILGTDF